MAFLRTWKELDGEIDRLWDAVHHEFIRREGIEEDLAIFRAEMARKANAEMAKKAMKAKPPMKAMKAMKGMKAMKTVTTTETGAIKTAGAYKSVAAAMGLKQKDVKAAVEGMLRLAATQTKKNGSFRVPGMLSFKLKDQKEKKEHTRKHPWQGRLCIFKARPASKTASVRPLKKLIRLVNV